MPADQWLCSCPSCSRPHTHTPLYHLAGSWGSLAQRWSTSFWLCWGRERHLPSSRLSLVQGCKRKRKQKFCYNCLWSFSDCHSGCSCVCNNPAIKCLMELKAYSPFFFFFPDEWVTVKPIQQQNKQTHMVFRPITAWCYTLRNIIATVTLLYRILGFLIWNKRHQKIENMLQGIQLTSQGRNTPA